MRLEQLLEEKRGDILRVAAEHGAREVRVFGSVARGEADRESDIDFLVELDTGRSLLDLGGLQMELESLLGRRNRARAQGAYSRARAAGSDTGVRDPKERLLDILDAIAAIERHRGRDKAAFERDELLQVWFLRHLQIIGEAARALPGDVRALAPEVPWSQIVGMRNILVHGNFDIDTDIVWDAATRDLLAIEPAVKRY